MVAADIILRSNNNWFPLANVQVLKDDAKGVTMHKIDMLTSQQLANLIEAHVDADMPLAFALACIDIEGIYDPDCINGNFTGSNKERAPEGFDVGCCQLKLRYVMASTGLGIDGARAFALTPTKAVPYFFGTMLLHLKSADGLLQNPPADMNPIYKNRYVLATSMYNFGVAGMEKAYTKNVNGQMTAFPPRITQPELVSHTTHVISLERSFAAELGVSSIFPVAA